MTKPILVSCALLFWKDKVLCAKRSQAMSQAGFWEFAGGKIEPNERPEQSLKREILEELNIDISVLMQMSPSEFAYSSDLSIRLLPFLCRWKAGEIKLFQHEEVRWLGRDELFSVNWAAADLPIVAELERFWIPIQKILAKDTQTYPYVS